MRTASPSARRRRFRRLAAGFALLTVIVLAAAVYWRLPLAGAVLRGALGYAGIDGVALGVSRLDGNGATIAGLRAGSALRVESLRVVWNHDDPFRRPLAAVTVSGVRLDFTGANAVFWARLTGREGRPRASAALARLVPRLPAVDAERVAVRLPNAADLAIEGSFRPHGDGCDLRFGARMADNAASMDAALSLSGLGGQPALSLSATVSTGLDLVARGIGGGMPLSGQARVELSGATPLSLSAAPLRALSDVLAAVGTPSLDARLFLDGVRWGAQVEEVDGRADVVLSLDAKGAPMARGRVRLGARRATVGSGSVADLHIDGVLFLHLSDGAVSVALPAPLAVTAERVTAGSAVLGPLALTVTGAAPTAVRIGPGGDPLRAVSAALAVETLPVAIRVDGDPVTVTPPLAMAGTARLSDGAARFLGQVTGLGGALAVAVDAHHDLRRQRGTARVVVEPLRLGPGGVQPRQIAPALARLSASAGTLGGRVDLRWDASGHGGTARVSLDGVDVAEADSGAAVAGLSGVLAFDGLAPPTTPPGQELRVARLDAGVRLDDVALRFRIVTDADATPALAVESLRARIAGGMLAVADGRVGSAGDAALPLRLSGVDLATVFDLVGVEGLDGTGTVDGTIPLAVAGGRLSVAGGRLTARGTGRLRLRSAAVRQALAAAGQEVAWMLQALEDFRYDRLSLAIEKPADGIAQLRLETLGNNPAVLQGRPFAINLNLEADVDRIAAALIEALSLPGRLVGTIVRDSR
jgi:hypothetical protein